MLVVVWSSYTMAAVFLASNRWEVASLGSYRAPGGRHRTNAADRTEYFPIICIGGAQAYPAGWRNRWGCARVAAVASAIEAVRGIGSRIKPKAVKASTVIDAHNTRRPPVSLSPAGCVVFLTFLEVSNGFFA